MNKHTVVTGTTDYYSVMKRNRLVLVATLGRVSKVLCSVKEVSLQRLYTLHGSVNVAFSERQTRDDNRLCGCQRLRREGGATAKESHEEGYWGCESILCPVVVSGSYL